MKFIDRTRIRVRAGDGGDGIVSFRSAKGRPKLGADGGDGGEGGDVLLVGKKGLNTLSSLRYRQTYRGENGGRGGSNGKTGRSGEPLLVPVPLGTVVVDEATGEVLGEVLEEGQTLLVAKGGRRGLGNMHWLRSTHQVPREFRPGGPGEERDLALELKLLADVGLAGFPNAGKSTLLSAVSAARPKIADYPFTTLTPNLGVVDVDSDKDAGTDTYWGESFVMADVPGLVEGASEGRGLGHEFLRHLERTCVIVYAVEAVSWTDEPQDALAKLERELRLYSPELASKRSLVLLTKIDLVQDDDELERLKAALSASGRDVLAVSAVRGDGLDALKRRLAELVRLERNAASPEPAAVSLGAEFHASP